MKLLTISKTKGWEYGDYMRIYNTKPNIGIMGVGDGLPYCDRFSDIYDHCGDCCRPFPYGFINIWMVEK